MDMMKVKVLIAAVLIALVFLFLIFWMFFHRPRYPYRAKPILTRREYSFYLLLQREASRRGLIICPKVGVKDLMEVTSRKHYMKYFRQIAQKHVDFVICDRELRVLFAVELDDGSHDTEEAKKRDQFKDRAFKAARIPLKRIRNFNEAAVWELFR